MELEIIQNVLQDAGIDVDLKTLQNPTEEFMVKLVIEYLKKFHFDGDKIAMPTDEQLKRVSCGESASDAVKAINLHAAFATICDKIFLKDLTLTDITSPGCKKVCKRIKMLFNFFVYVRSKNAEKEPLFFELEDRHKVFQDMIEKKEEYTAKIGALVHEQELKLEHKEKMKKEIERIKLLIGKDETVRVKLQKRIDEVKIEQQAAVKKSNVSKAKTHALHNAVKDLENKIVKSPEEYVSRNEELKRILERKIEERQELNEKINRHKHQVQIFETADSLVTNYYTKMTRIGEILKNLKETHSEIITTTKQLHELKGEINSLEHQPNNTVERKSTNGQAFDFEKNQRLLLELQNSLIEKEKEHNLLKLKSEDLLNERKRVVLSLQKENEKLSLAEDNLVKFMHASKNSLDNLLCEEHDLRIHLSGLKK